MVQNRAPERQSGLVAKPSSWAWLAPGEGASEGVPLLWLTRVRPSVRVVRSLLHAWATKVERALSEDMVDIRTKRNPIKERKGLI